MNQIQYSMAFTGGDLFFHESVALAELYIELSDWAAVQARVIETNVLQLRMQSSMKRVFREIRQRLELLTAEQMALLIDSSPHEQKWLLWIAVCKRYQYIADFAREVIRENIRSLNYTLTVEDYDAFFNAKAEWHDELEVLTDSTKQKVKQVLFRMMHEAEILSRENGILVGMLDERLASVVVQDDPACLAMLPVTDAEIQEWLR